MAQIISCSAIFNLSILPEGSFPNRCSPLSGSSSDFGSAEFDISQEDLEEFQNIHELTENFGTKYYFILLGKSGESNWDSVEHFAWVKFCLKQNSKAKENLNWTFEVIFSFLSFLR